MLRMPDVATVWAIEDCVAELGDSASALLPPRESLMTVAAFRLIVPAVPSLPRVTLLAILLKEAIKLFQLYIY
jgi:hypothetical protein